MIIELTNENFEEKVLKSDVPVLVDFWATWCGPCKRQGPVLDDLEPKSGGKFAVGKVNVDNEPALAQKYGVMSIPTLIVFKDGEVKETAVGFRSEDNLLEMLNA